MKKVYDLNVYKLSEKLSVLIWYNFDKCDNKVQKSVGHQILRSANSIYANIAENFGRYFPADRKKIMATKICKKKYPE